jgi:integral membrane sensor domain MASE1
LHLGNSSISERLLSSIVSIIFVAVGYLALAALSTALAYAPTDAWTVWLASGWTLGLMVVQSRHRWIIPLAGAAIGAAVFAMVLPGGRFVDSIGYAAIEVLAAAAGAFASMWLAPPPLRLDGVRELGGFVVGALVQALVGAALAAVWNIVSGGSEGIRTFSVWSLAAFVGAILVAPLVMTWSAFRLKRSGGLTMPQFAGGAVASLLFLVSLYMIFSGDTGQRFGGSVGAGLTYVPVLFMSVIALVWGARGASLIAFLGALIALFNTIRDTGPFASVDAFVGEAELEVQVYVAIVALTGLLIAALEARQRNALLQASEWRTRFEGTIGAHRLLAYEWDPIGGAFAVSGDTMTHLGVPPAKLSTLADWLSHVSPSERDTTATAFSLRADGALGPALTYRMARQDGNAVTLVDEAQALRDHDGSLYRVTGIVHIQDNP